MIDTVAYRTMHPMFKDSFDYFNMVDKDMKEALWLYMVHGIEPGSFCMAVLRNDFLAAATKAHPALTTETFRDLAKWLYNVAPYASYGTADKVDAWIALTDIQRRDIMIEHRLRPSVIDILKGLAVA